LHNRLTFESHFSKEIIAAFEDGRITSDAGLQTGWAPGIDADSPTGS
jgi:hypothetical protein